MADPKTETPVVPPYVAQRLRTLSLQIGHVQAAQLVWDQHLLAPQQAALGASFEDAYESRPSIVAMWRRLYPVSPPRAVIDISRKLGFISEAEHRLLEAEVSLVNGNEDVETQIESAITTGKLVLIQSPSRREAHWAGAVVEPERGWETNRALWDFFWALSSKAKGGTALNWAETTNTDAKTAKDLKGRLKKFLPAELWEMINAELEPGSYRLSLATDQIELFEVSDEA